jgi:Flp pilus assembly protein TadG
MTSTRCSPKLRCDRTGAAAIELAVCLPLLLLFALACGDFGRISYFHQTLANAARTAAESGASHRFTPFTQAAWEEDVYAAAFAEMQNIPRFDEGSLNFELSTSTDADGLVRVVVDVSYPFRTVVAWPGLPYEVLLDSTAEFRQFR